MVRNRNFWQLPPWFFESWL